MKKRVWMLALLLSTALAAAGCKQESAEEKDTDPRTEETSSDGTEETDSEDTESEDTENKEDDVKTTAELMADIDVDSCVVLGEYKGISVEKAIDAVVEQAIQEALAKYPVEVDKAAEEGDTVNINYVGTIDGEAFEGGSAQGTDLQLGSGKFIDGFESGLIGARKGETRTLDLTFPSQYTEELAGKDVQFTVTINTVKVPLEEPTDEWVAANIEGYYTLDEYREALSSSPDNQKSAEDKVRYNAWMQAVENSTIKNYPDTLVEMGKNLYISEVEMYASYQSMDLDTFLESSDMTREDFETAAEEYGKEIAARALVCQAISNAEGFAIGDAGYQEELNKMLTEYGTTEEELIKVYGQDNIEQSIMLNRVSNLILENAVITEPKAEEVSEEPEA